MITAKTNQGVTVVVPKEAELEFLMATELMHQKKYDDAIKYYKKAIAIDPEYSLAWHYKGNCYDDMGKHDDACRAYDMALKLDPYHSDTWYNKSITLNKIGKTADAKSHADTAINLELGR